MAEFAARLAERGWLLADGATGTNLFAAGLAAGEAPELWNDANPEAIADLYRSSARAGAEIILTNSFGGNASRLALHGAQRRVRELSRLAAEIAREVADSGDSAVHVAGSVGPTGDLMAPMGKLTADLAREMFHEQIEGLKEGGIDFVWIETMSDIDELDAAAEAARLAGLDACATMSFDTAGKTMMGIDASRLSGWANGRAEAPLAVGANCGTGASDLVRTVLEFSDSPVSCAIIAKANAGIPKFDGGKVRYDGSPELMADYAELARNAGARIIGGCCGTGFDHLAAMRARLESASVGSPPELSELTAKLGPLTARARQPDAPRRMRRRGRG